MTPGVSIGTSTIDWATFVNGLLIRYLDYNDTYLSKEPAHPSDNLAAVDGDFIMTAEEVQPVLRTLRKADFHFVALHNHMVGEQPALYFTHFWGKGPASELASGIRSALDAQAKVGKNKEKHQ